MSFADVIADNPPRLAVLFQRGQDGSEQFQWGVAGSIPMLSLIGGIVRVQASLLGDEWIPECDLPEGQPSALVIVWEKDDRTFSHYLSPEIPREPLVGMLETIKAMLVAGRLGQHSASQKVQLLGPDGSPMRF